MVQQREGENNWRGMSAVEEMFSLNFPQNSYFPDGDDASQGASYLEPRGHGDWVSCPAASACWMSGVWQTGSSGVSIFKVWLTHL